jgi:uncharacterized protein (TIGR01732 family)
MENKKMNIPYGDNMNIGMKPIANMPIHGGYGGGYDQGHGYGCGFLIIVVLFILLIIIGATAFHGKDDFCDRDESSSSH